MKFFLITLLAVLALAQAQRDLGTGVAHQAFKTAVNKLLTGTTRYQERTRDAARCARTLTYALRTTGDSRQARNACGNTLRRATNDNIYNINNNIKGNEDYKTGVCARCLVRNYYNGDNNVNTRNANNDYACTTRCRACDLDKILQHVYQSNVGGGGGVGGTCPNTNNPCGNIGNELDGGVGIGQAGGQGGLGGLGGFGGGQGGGGGGGFGGGQGGGGGGGFGGGQGFGQDNDFGGGQGGFRGIGIGYRGNDDFGGGKFGLGKGGVFKGGLFKDFGF